MKLLGLSSYKTSKGESKGYLTGILYLNPLDYDICPMATDGCKAACLYTAGRGSMKNVKAGRTRKTELYLNDRELFKAQLRKDIAALRRKALREGLIPVVRLNGTSDLPFFATCGDIMKENKDIIFYDYTKVIKYWHKAQGIDNYHVTFSASESNQAEVSEVLAQGGQVAVVSEYDNLYFEQAHGVKVEEGDSHDLTFLRNSQVLVLSPKGKAKKDNTGFNHIPLVEVAA